MNVLPLVKHVIHPLNAHHAVEIFISKEHNVLHLINVENDTLLIKTLINVINVTVTV